MDSMAMDSPDGWFKGLGGDSWLVAVALVCRKLCSCDGGESLPDSMLSIGLRRETAEMGRHP